MAAHHPGAEFTWRRSQACGFGFFGERRRVSEDPFTVVADAGARDRIRRAVAEEPADVFLERTRQVFTDQRPGHLAFEPHAFTTERYGVLAAGGVRFFSLTGEPRADAPPHRPGQ